MKARWVIFEPKRNGWMRVEVVRVGPGSGDRRAGSEGVSYTVSLNEIMRSLGWSPASNSEGGRREKDARRSGGGNLEIPVEVDREW